MPFSRRQFNQLCRQRPKMKAKMKGKAVVTFVLVSIICDLLFVPSARHLQFAQYSLASSHKS
jgi:hypothetical protein